MATTQVVLCPDKELTKPQSQGQRDFSIDFLRTTLVMMVVADHCALPYASARTGWRNMILSDVTRAVSFDCTTYFIDVFCMSLMFFVSGLFVYRSLQRHGAAGFIRDRFLRLGIPFVFSVVVLLPIAMYAPWLLTGHNAGFAGFYIQLPARDFPIGPPWFLWELLFFDLVLVLTLMPLQRWMPQVQRLMSRLRNYPVAAFVTVYFSLAFAYLPLAHHYGSGFWTVLITWPFSFRPARIGLYALWFLFGFFVGAPGLGKGLIAHDGSLARHWPHWVVGCILAFNALWFVPRWITAHPLIIPHARGLALLWVASCVAGCFGFLALFRGITMPPLSWMKSLSRSAYVIYLVHYVFIAWLQFFVLRRPMNVGLKFLLVFLVTTLLSWLTAQLLLRIPILRTIL